MGKRSGECQFMTRPKPSKSAKSAWKLLGLPFLLVLASLDTSWAEKAAKPPRTLTIVVTDSPAGHLKSPLYLAGNINNWNPASAEHQLHPNNEGLYSITLSQPESGEDLLEFKLTRGNWKTSECSSEGTLGAPRIVSWESPSPISCRIQGWRDQFPSSTASSNVHLLSREFPMPELRRTGRVSLYLPSDYESSNKRYPVLYMQDGQHLFDEETSVGRMGPIEWGIDEHLDRLTCDLIVVAVDHHPDLKQRIVEYQFHPTKESPRPLGPNYLDFLVRNLKPHIDAHYRTKPQAATTGILGSSMGGLLSLYAGLKYPDVFGRVGVFSPSLWSDGDYLQRELAGLQPNNSLSSQRYFFYAGDRETRKQPDGRPVSMAADTSKASELVESFTTAQVHLEIASEGRHNALSWGLIFPKFHSWFQVP